MKGSLVEWRYDKSTVIGTGTAANNITAVTAIDSTHLLDNIDALALAPGFQYSSFDYVSFRHSTGNGAGIWGFVGFDRLRTNNPEERFSRLRSVGILTSNYELGRKLVPLLAWLANELNLSRSSLCTCISEPVDSNPKSDESLNTFRLVSDLLMHSDLDVDAHVWTAAEVFTTLFKQLSVANIKRYLSYCRKYSLNSCLIESRSGIVCDTPCVSLPLYQGVDFLKADPGLLCVCRALLENRRVLFFSKVGLGRICDIAWDIIKHAGVPGQLDNTTTKNNNARIVDSGSDGNLTAATPSPLLFRTGMYCLAEIEKMERESNSSSSGGNSPSTQGWLMVTSDASLIEQGVIYGCDWEVLVVFDSVLDITNEDKESRAMLNKDAGSMEHIGERNPTVNFHSKGYTIRVSTTEHDPGRPPASESFIFAPALDEALIDNVTRIGATAADNTNTGVLALQEGHSQLFVTWWRGVLADINACSNVAVAISTDGTSSGENIRVAKTQINMKQLEDICKQYGIPPSYFPWVHFICADYGIEVLNNVNATNSTINNINNIHKTGTDIVSGSSKISRYLQKMFCGFNLFKKKK